MSMNTYGIKTIGEVSKDKEKQMQVIFDMMNENELHHLIVEFTETGVLFHNPGKTN